VINVDDQLLEVARCGVHRRSACDAGLIAVRRDLVALPSR